MLPIPLPPTAMGLLDSVVASRLWEATKTMVRSFVSPRLPWELPAEYRNDLLMGLLVFGVFLVVAGTAFAGKARGKFWQLLAVGAGVAVAGWVVFGGRADVATFFVIILLVLKFLGGVTFVLGLFRSWWLLALIFLSIMLAATGTLDAALLGRIIALVASFRGALSLFKRAEEFTPGRKGSRWNRRTAVGWVACLLAASMLEGGGLGAWSKEFKLTGMVVGLAIVLLTPGLFGRGGVSVKVKRG